MTSLVITRFAPDDVSSGAALRNWQNIRGLARLGPVDVVAVGVDAVPRPVVGVRDWVAFPLPPVGLWRRAWRRSWVLRAGAFSGIDRFHLDEAIRWMRRRSTIRRYDVALVEGIALASYVRALGRVADRVVFDAHNVEGQLSGALMAGAGRPSMLARLRQRVVQRRLATVERRAVTGAHLVWACSALDASYLGDACRTHQPVAVVANGVDVGAYRPSGAEDDEDWTATPITLVYTGLFSYEPNADAAMRLITAVLPALRATGVDVRLVLVGRDPTQAMRDAAQRDSAIEVTGEVASVLPYLHQRCVVTLPIAMGGGTRLKIVEAFAAGRPVVSSVKGAEGIAVRDGEHLLLRDDATGMARAVVALWREPRLRLRLRANALALVQGSYSWESAAAAIAASLGVSAATPAIGGRP